MTVAVLLVEPDEVERAALRRTLRSHGCVVIAVSSAEDALYEHAQRDVDVVVTNVELAGMDGIELCRVLSMQSTVAVVVIDRRPACPAAIEALDAGADDVVGAGQSGELAARVKAVVRRRRGALRPRRQVRVGDLVAEWTAGGGLAAVDARYPLTPAEGTILEVLAERPGCIVPDEVLRQRLSERHGPATAATLEAALTRLADRLAAAGAATALQRIPDSGWLLAA